MKNIMKMTGVTLVCASLALTPGCQTAGSGAASGAVFGGALGSAIGIATHHPELGAAIGVAAGMFTGAVIGAMNEQQRAQLQAQSPQTLQTLQYNDQVYQQQQQAAQSPPPAGQPAPAVDAPKPLTLDDLKALVSVGLKPDAINAEITRSNTHFTQADIDALKQSNPNVDPSVITCMQKSMSSWLATDILGFDIAGGAQPPAIFLQGFRRRIVLVLERKDAANAPGLDRGKLNNQI
jgi:hypothetical protein